MKVLVVLSAFVASCLVSPSFGYTYGYSAYAPYSAISPLFGGISPVTPYAYNAPLISAPLPVPYAAAPYAAAPYAAAPAVIPAAVAGVKTQYHSQNELGEASYGHTEPTQSHHAIQDAAGNKVGSFSYIGQYGEHHQTNYVADAAGYRVAANDIPVDTPEVVAAKAQHFAAKLAAPLYRRKRSLFSSNVGGWGIPAVLASGHIADTPEVAAAKAAHFAEVAKASGHAYTAAAAYVAPAAPAYTAPAYVAPAAPAYHGYYASGYAQTVVRPDGFLADTPEVAAAKAAHFAEKAKVSGHPAVPYAAATYAATPYASQYTHASGPWAVPVVKPDGFLADTPEVAAAKSAHFAEHHARGKRSITPAATTLLHPFVTPAISYAAPPVAYSAHYSYAAPYAYSTPYAHGIPAVKTVITHNPFHAVSERIDPIVPYYK